MDCRRCGGEGKLTIKLGVPDPERDTHSRYDGPWRVFDPVTCGVCHGTGEEKDKPPPRPYRGAIEIRDPDDISRWF